MCTVEQFSVANLASSYLVIFFRLTIDGLGALKSKDHMLIIHVVTFGSEG